MVECSLGIMAHNEEENIRLLLNSLLNQSCSGSFIRDIIVVSSGSTDRTDEIVREFCLKDSRIRLLRQAERLGKSSAINLFFKQAKQKICVLVNSDCILEPDAIEILVRPFTSAGVGMTGGHPIPLNHSRRFLERVINFMWGLHHEIALCFPKMSELVAFRKDLVGEVPALSAVDEISIEWLVKKSGHQVLYLADAKAYIRVPNTSKDFLSQRRRIATGHLWAKEVLHYIPATRNVSLVVKLALRKLIQSPPSALVVLAAAILEFIARMLGRYDYYICGRNPYIWPLCLSTKNKQQNIISF